MPAYETRCVDDGNAVPQGAIGELWVKGAAVIKGYINRPEATAAAITDGWLHTDDIARIDEGGLIYVVDREKDMVLRGDKNIYCAEVEATIYRHPAIAECCVFGVPDERLGEVVGAAVVAKPGETLTMKALQQHCSALMAAQGASSNLGARRYAARQCQPEVSQARAARMAAHGIACLADLLRLV